MAKLNGKALLPNRFVFQHMLPALMKDIHLSSMLKFPIRRYAKKYDAESEVPISQISLRVNEVCNLACASCGQWGENGHIRMRQDSGEKLDQLDFDTVKRLVVETRHDQPAYYVWGGEPTLWKPLLPLFKELGKHKLFGSIVTNGQALEPLIEDLIDTGALSILFLSLDGWDAESQNKMRSSKSGKTDNFEKVMRIIDKVDEIKKRKGLKMPFVVPITVISNINHAHLADIHRLVRDKTQLHPYYYGWYITEERAAVHEKVFKDRFGFEPENHKGYLKSCFNDVDPKVAAKQIKEIMDISKGHQSVPQILPDIYSEVEIRRYYDDHSWDVGYKKCDSIYHVVEVSPDGSVTPCRDYQDYDVGNINDTAFYDIWNGEKYKKFRREMEKGLMPVCTRCCGLQGF